MSFLGRFQNGVVVFDGPIALDNGTPVRVEPLRLRMQEKDRGTPDAVRCFNDQWAGDPNELDALLAELQHLRNQDLTPIDES